MTVKVRWHGVTLDRRSARMMAEVQRHVKFRIRPTQGSYSRGVGASAGTHNGGGAIDISTRGLTRAQKTRLIRWMRTVGWAAWVRSPIPGVWGEHIHGIAIGAPDQPALARAQVADYRRGRNGLAGHAKDRHLGLMKGHGGSVHYQTWQQYRAKR